MLVLNICHVQFCCYLSFILNLFNEIIWNFFLKCLCCWMIKTIVGDGRKNTSSSSSKRWEGHRIASVINSLIFAYVEVLGLFSFFIVYFSLCGLYYKSLEICFSSYMSVGKNYISPNLLYVLHPISSNSYRMFLC
jgi:hypothetical protein